MTAALSTPVSDRWRKSENVYVCVAFKEALGSLEKARMTVACCVAASGTCTHVVGVRKCGRPASLFCPEK